MRKIIQDLALVTKLKLSAANAGVSYLLYLSGVPPITFNFGQSLEFYTGAFLMACSSQAYNQVIEYKEDGFMKRAKFRPIVECRLTPGQVQIFSGGLALSSIYLLSQFNPIAPIVGCTI